MNFPEYTITLIRHGETKQNKQDRFIGITDSPLNNIGRLQAEKTSVYLQNTSWKFDCLLSSPLKRCQETSQILQSQINLPIDCNPLLQERDYGVFENHLKSSVKTKYPTIYEKYKFFKPFIKIPQGESALDVENRIRKLLWDEFPTKYSKFQHFLIITHLNPIRATLHLLGLKDWQVYFLKISNASITRINWNLKQAHIEVMNFTQNE